MLCHHLKSNIQYVEGGMGEENTKKRDDLNWR